MKLHDLKPDKGAHRRKTRVGQGISAGKGKTAGRGTKGQGARTGGGKGPYFEGGQLPLVRRLPFKKGFSSPFKIAYQVVNVDQLERHFKRGEEVNPMALASKGLVKEVDGPIKILGGGELKAALVVKAHGFTQSAQEKIEKAGGSVETLDLPLSGSRATVKKLRQEQLETMEESA